MTENSDEGETSDSNFAAEQKEFLLKSLHELDQEFENGNLSLEDHEMLVRRYTRELANVTEAKKVVDSGSEPKKGYRTKALVWSLGIVLLGAAAGITISQTSGARSSGESITGSIRKSVSSQISEAQMLLGNRDRWGEAIEIFDDVLETQPSNVEALTYRAWLNYQSGGEVSAQIKAWEEVLFIEPGYSDALVFLSISLSNEGRYDEASLYLDQLRSNPVREDILAIVQQRGLYGEVYGEALYPTIVDISKPTLEELQLEAEIGLEVANYLLLSEKDERTVSAIKIYRAIIMDFPSHPEALSREALLLAQTGDQDLFAKAIDQMNFAVAENPNNVEALLSRATVLAEFDQEGACNDLESINEILAAGDQSAEEPIRVQMEKIRAFAACT
jgi:tetratricopeptide (TPR) repeat protein